MNLVKTGDALDHHYSATVLADSISPRGHRMTTFRLVYPRFIHSEMMTHRMLSRNAASSRAIPTERLIDQVRTDPFVPATFNQRVAGMGVGEQMDSIDAAAAEKTWRAAAEMAATYAEDLMKGRLDKSRANRILEPYLWYTAIFSGTEWDNFLALRDHPGAQPEIQAVARCIRRAFEESEPVRLEAGFWHLPLVTGDELADLCKLRELHGSKTTPVDQALQRLKMLSASRCARVSYDRDDDEPIVKTLERAETLMGNGHYSPFEHVAEPFSDSEWADVESRQIEERARAENQNEGPVGLDAMEFQANLRGWVNMRYAIPNESRFDLAMGV